MTHINMAKNPWVFTFFSLIFFLRRMLYSTPRPVYFHWNYNLDKQNTLRFHSNNNIYAKKQKEETIHILNHYLKLSKEESFCGKTTLMT